MKDKSEIINRLIELLKDTEETSETISQLSILNFLIIQNHIYDEMKILPSNILISTNNGIDLEYSNNLMKLYFTIEKEKYDLCVSIYENGKIILNDKKIKLDLNLIKEYIHILYKYEHHKTK